MAATTSGDLVTRSGVRHALDHGRNGLGPECGLSRGVLVPIGPGHCFTGEKMNAKFPCIFLIHLSQSGELIGYPWSGVRRPPSSSTISSPKPLGQTKPNFVWSLLKGERKFVWSCIPTVSSLYPHCIPTVSLQREVSEVRKTCT